MCHFEKDLDEKVAEELSGCTNCQKEQVKVGITDHNMPDFFMTAAVVV